MINDIYFLFLLITYYNLNILNIIVKHKLCIKKYINVYNILQLKLIIYTFFE